MALVVAIVAFAVLGIAVAFVAFTGGPSRARQAYLTGGRRTFKIVIPILYVGLGIVVPVLVITSRPAAEGSQAPLSDKAPNAEFKHGKTLFRQTCWSCHTLKAAGARGVTGPNLDQIGPVTETRVLNAIRIGGTGLGRMPSGLLRGADAQAVAYYVSHVAGQ